MADTIGYLLESDALNGKAGAAWIDFLDPNTGISSVKKLFELKNLDVNCEFQEADFDVVGCLVTQKKTKSANLTGSMTIYNGSPLWLKMVYNYLHKQALPYINITVVNDEMSSRRGVQRITLTGVKLSKLPITKLDATADFLETDVSFSFLDIVLHDQFVENIPTGSGSQVPTDISTQWAPSYDPNYDGDDGFADTSPSFSQFNG